MSVENIAVGAAVEYAFDRFNSERDCVFYFFGKTVDVVIALILLTFGFIYIFRPGEMPFKAPFYASNGYKRFDAFDCVVNGTRAGEQFFAGYNRSAQRIFTAYEKP